MEKLNHPVLVEVCSECLRASCWQDELRCENYRSADIIYKTVDELRILGLESEDYWPIDNPTRPNRDMGLGG